MIQTDKRRCKELLIYRMFLAVTLSIFVKLLFMSHFVLFVNLNVDYKLWLHATWTTIISFRMFSYFIIVAIMTLLQGVLCSRNYLYVPLYHKSRFTKFRRILTIHNLSPGALYIVIGGISTWLDLSLKGRSTLTTDCNIVYGPCLVEEHYFLLLSGLWGGLYFYIKSSDIVGKHIQFSVISQSILSQMKRRIYAVLPRIMIYSVWSTLYYIVGYYFLGWYCRAVLLSVTSIQVETESKLLNLSLILQLWQYQFLFMITTNITYLLFEICLTEWISFKIGLSGSQSTDDSELMLIDALSMNKIPIMQHLGYLDLVILAQKEKIRRGALFTLSQPGGHPYNWNCIVQKCLDLLKKAASDLNAVSVKLQDQQFSYNANILAAAVPSVLRTEYVYHMRRLVPEKASLTEVTDTEENPYNDWSVQKFIKQKRDAFVTYLFSKPLINYIFGEQEDNKVRYILNNGQPVIWAAEAISSLSVFSLSEDPFGIVQKDISQIITVLLTVKQALDKLQKSPILMRKIQADDKCVKEMFTSLRSAIKRSLYRIITNFEPYISDLVLEPTVKEQLLSFLNYKE